MSSEFETKNVNIPEKYTSLEGWYELEQSKWEAADKERGYDELLRARRVKRIAEDAMRLSARFDNATASESEVLETEAPGSETPIATPEPDDNLKPGVEEVPVSTPEKLIRVTTFEQARTLEGNSIDDILDAIDDYGISLDDHSGWGGPFDRYVRKRAGRKASSDEIDFFKLRVPENAATYDAELMAFTSKLAEQNPYPDKRSVTHVHAGWLQHDSKGLIEDRVENSSSDQLAGRIYLTPKFGMEMLEIYKEIFTKAEQAGLRFKAKVYDPSIRGRSERIEGYKNLYNFDEQRTDPMLFYPFEESKDALLAIAIEVYNKHISAFEGMHTGAIPVEIAPGLAVGSEPKGHSGRESLTTHRYKLDLAFDMAAEHPEWDTATHAQKREISRAYLQKVAEENNIDPENIAFDAH